MSEMIRTGIPASITLAQGILESQSGESDLAKTSNNHFGIKCKTEWTGAKTYHDDDLKSECFRVYPSVEDSYKDHSEFLKSRPHYAFLFQLDPTDYDGWAKGLKKAGYATSPTYPQKLLKVINDYNLQQYSLQAMEKKKMSSTADIAIPVKKTKKDYQHNSNAENENTQEIKQLTNEPVLSEQRTTPKKSYPSGIFLINHSKVVFVKEGSSFLALANQYDIILSKLFSFNELPELEVLDKDRLIFLEKKMKTGITDTHIAEAGESLHDIAQAEGVRLESLMEYNKLNKNIVLNAGDKVLLQTANDKNKKVTVTPK